MNTSGLDLYLFSTYKTFGTHIGVMWGRRSVLDTLEPQGHYFNRDLPHYKFNPAGPLHAEIGALAGIEEYIDAIYDHRALGIQDTDNGIIRISLVHYNTEEEVSRLVEGLRAL